MGGEADLNAGHPRCLAEGQSEVKDLTVVSGRQQVEWSLHHIWCNVSMVVIVSRKSQFCAMNI